MNDIDCPYCGKSQQINHDDGYGYEEWEIYEQECGDCGKIFVYTTSISFYYEASKADCKNGGEHDLRPIHGYPGYLFTGIKECFNCGDRIVVDKEAHEKAMENK